MLNPSTFRITLKSMFFVFLFCFFFSFTVKLHCYDNPCKNNGTCHNHSNNYTCECRPGFMGEVCQGKISWRFSDMKLYIRIPGLESLYTCFTDNFGKFLAILMSRLIYMYFSDRSLLRRAMPKQWILRQLWQSLPVHLSCSICWTKLWRWMSHRFPSSWLPKVMLYGTIRNDDF